MAQHPQYDHRMREKDMRPPLNGRGQAPTHGANESAERLREKMRELHGAANRARAQAEADRVLATARPSV